MLALWGKLTENVIIVVMLRFPTSILRLCKTCVENVNYSPQNGDQDSYAQRHDGQSATRLHRQRRLIDNYREFCLPLNLRPRTASECLFRSLVSDPVPGTNQFLKIMVNRMTWSLSGCAARTVFIYKSADPEFRLRGLSYMFTDILEIYQEG